MQSIRLNPSSLLPWMLALPVIAVLAPAADALDPVTVPFEMGPRGHLIVSAGVNGEELRLMVDTAAGSCVLEPDAVERLGLQGDGKKEVVRGEHGDSRQEIFQLDGLTIGNRTRDGLKTASQDLSHITRDRYEIDGIVGANYLREFDVRFDFTRKEMTLYDQADKTADCEVCPEDATAVPFEMYEQGHILVPAGVEETRMTGLLDSGSGHSGINSLVTKALGLELPEPASTSGLHGHGFGIQGGPIYLGDVVLQEKAQLMVVERDDIFEPFGLADKPRMLIGTDLFEGRVLSISYGTKQLFVE